MKSHRSRVIIHFDDDGDVRDDDDNAWADPWSGKRKALSPSLAHPARASIDLVTIGNPNDTLGAIGDKRRRDPSRPSYGNVSAFL